MIEIRIKILEGSSGVVIECKSDMEYETLQEMMTAMRLLDATKKESEKILAEEGGIMAEGQEQSEKLKNILKNKEGGLENA